VIVDARSPAAKVTVCDVLATKPSSMVVLHLEQLDRAAQIEMVRLLKRSPGTVLAATLGRTLELALSDGLLAPAVVSLINGRRVRVPALEERREDIAPIVTALCERAGIPTSILTPDLLEQFMRGGWRAGFREIGELLRELASPSMSADDRLAKVRDRSSRPGMRLPLALQQEDPDLARARLQRALDRAGGTIAAAARELRVSRQAFYREIKRLNVELPRKKLRDALPA
jgi:transcriptional regulator of acetoin/glycerol metabolism